MGLTNSKSENWLSEWKLVEFLGSGSYGGVYKAEKRNTKSCAVKITYLQKHLLHGVDDEKSLDEARVRMRREFFLPFGKSHTNIVNVYESLETQIDEWALNDFLKPVINSKDRNAELVKANMKFWAGETGLDAFFIRMELCGKDLRQWIDNCTVKGLRLCYLQINIIDGILEGLKFLHQNKILHRDLKSENIFFALDSNICLVKIGDFGIGRIVLGDGSKSASKPLTTPLYKAPELDSGKYTLQADLFSLGLLIYEIIKMIKSNDRKVEFTRIKTRAISIDLPKEPFENARDVILKLTESETTKRLKTVEAIELKFSSDLVVLDNAEYEPHEFCDIVYNHNFVIGHPEGGTLVAGDFELFCDDRVIQNVTFKCRSYLKIRGNNNKLSNINFQSDMANNWPNLNVAGNNNTLTDTQIQCSNWAVEIEGEGNTISSVTEGEENNASVRFYSWLGVNNTIQNIRSRHCSIWLFGSTSSCHLENVKCSYNSYLGGNTHILRNVECQNLEVVGKGHKFFKCKGSVKISPYSNYEFVDCSLKHESRGVYEF